LRANVAGPFQAHEAVGGDVQDLIEFGGEGEGNFDDIAGVKPVERIAIPS
jgi:hypothetical protein